MKCVKLEDMKLNINKLNADHVNKHMPQPYLDSITFIIFSYFFSICSHFLPSVHLLGRDRQVVTRKFANLCSFLSATHMGSLVLACIHRIAEVSKGYTACVQASVVKHST